MNPRNTEKECLACKGHRQTALLINFDRTHLSYSLQNHPRSPTSCPLQILVAFLPCPSLNSSAASYPHYYGYAALCFKLVIAIAP